MELHYLHTTPSAKRYLFKPSSIPFTPFNSNTETTSKANLLRAKSSSELLAADQVSKKQKKLPCSCKQNIAKSNTQPLSQDSAAKGKNKPTEMKDMMKQVRLKNTQLKEKVQVLLNRLKKQYKEYLSITRDYKRLKQTVKKYLDDTETIR